MNIIIKPGVTIIIKRNVIALLIQTTVYVQALLISCLNLYVFWGSYLPIQLMLYQARAMLDRFLPCTCYSHMPIEATMVLSCYIVAILRLTV